jgi:hypothetical protein
VYKTAQITRQNSAEQSLKWEVQRRSALYIIFLRRHFCLCEGVKGVEGGRVSGSAFIWNRWCKDYSCDDNMYHVGGVHSLLKNVCLSKR